MGDITEACSGHRHGECAGYVRLAQHGATWCTCSCHSLAVAAEVRRRLQAATAYGSSVSVAPAGGGMTTLPSTDAAADQP